MVEHRRDQTGTVVKRVVRHTPIIASFAADSVFRQKIAEYPGHNAYLACGSCTFQGSRVDGCRPVRYLGYEQPVSQTRRWGPTLHALGSCRLACRPQGLLLLPLLLRAAGPPSRGGLCPCWLASQLQGLGACMMRLPHVGQPWGAPGAPTASVWL